MGSCRAVERLLLTASAAACLLTAAHAGFPKVTPTQGEPWPTPESIAITNQSFLVARPGEFEFSVVGAQCVDLWQAVIRYQKVIQDLAGPTGRGRSPGRRRPPATPLQAAAALTRAEVNLSSSCDGRPLPEFGMDESYTVVVDVAGDGSAAGSVAADSLWGVLRGLETFAQLMYVDDGGLYIRQAAVSDSPRYSHRGLLLDTARHYYQPSTIKDLLDVMAINKLNVFHWHIVDDQSFPYVSAEYPVLAEVSAYAEDMVYGADVVEEVIEYARLRGIRVIPEFDTPGHTQSWGAALPGFTTACYGDDFKPDGTFGPVDPSNEDVYIMLKLFLGEVTEVFPDKYVHLGGDEVSFGFDCWLSNPHLVAWMKSLNISSPQEIESVYIARLLDLVQQLPTSPEYVVWQEVIDNGVQVKPDTIVEVWKGGWEQEMATVTGQDHRAILSTCWYLDHVSYGADWVTFYNCEPESFNGTAAQNQLVIGGEACMWSEFVDDTNVMPRIWPRASSVAERLWSPKNTTHSDHTDSRMEEHRCRMLRRGYNAEPPNGPGFC